MERWWLWRALVRATPQPDAAFLLLIAVQESLRRSEAKGAPFPDPPAVLARRLAEYEALAKEGHWQVMDGRRPISELAEEIADVFRGRVQGVVLSGTGR